MFFREYRERRRQKKASRRGAFEQWRSWPKILPFLRPYKKLVGLSFFLVVVTSIVALAEPWPLAMVIDSVLGTKPPPSLLRNWFGASPDPYRLLVFVVGLGFIIVILSHGLRIINDYVNARVEQNIVLNLRTDLFAQCQRLSLTFHDERHTGQLMSLINLQASSIGGIVMSIPPLLESFLMLIGMLTIAFISLVTAAIVATTALDNAREVNPPRAESSVTA